MAIVQFQDLSVPVDARHVLNILVTILFVIWLSNVILGLDWVRHRWRRFLFASRVLGISCWVLFLAFPCQLLAVGMLQSMPNGCVDPSLDIPSFRRNRQALPKKVLFFFGFALHHGAGLLFGAQVLRPLVQASNAGLDVTVFNLQGGVLVVLLCQALRWVLHMLVLQRRAPKWMNFLNLPLAFVQTMAMLCTLLFDNFEDRIPAEYLVAIIIGNSIEFVADIAGNKVSTHEELESLPSVSYERQMSVARHLHGVEPIGADDSVKRRLSALEPVAKDGMDEGIAKVIATLPEPCKSLLLAHFLTHATKESSGKVGASSIGAASLQCEA